jgi:hypothetical protein
MKPPGSDLIRGALAAVSSYREAPAQAGSHLSNGDPGSTQILTRHFDVQSQTVSQLTELKDYAFWEVLAV